MNAITPAASNGCRNGSRTLTPTGRWSVDAPAAAFEPARLSAGTQRRRRRGEHVANGVVELAHAAEAGGEGDVRERHGGRLDEQTGRLRALHPGERERTGTEFVGEEPVQVTFAVAEPTGESGNTVALDGTVGDEAHRPADEVLTGVPLGRSRRGIGPTSLAGPEPSLLGRGRRRQELDVGALGGDRRTARTAVDAGRPHGRDEPAVEPVVAALDGDVAVVGVEREHVTIMPDRNETDWRKSDATIDWVSRRRRARRSCEPACGPGRRPANRPERGGTSAGRDRARRT